MSELDYISYKPTRGPESADMEWIAERVAYYLKNRLEKGTLTKITTEDIIEEFRSLNDDYDDWWSRGLNTKEKELSFMKALLTRLEHYDITDVVDNTFV